MFTTISRSFPRTGIVVVALILLALPLTLSATPLSLASSSYFYTLNANTVISRMLNTVSVYDSITYAGDDLSWASTGSPASWSQAVLSLYTILSQTPAAHIEASVTTFGSGYASSVGDVQVGYSARIRQVDSPPVATPLLPVRFRGVGFGSVTGSGGFHSHISVTYPTVFKNWSTNTNIPSFEVDELLWLSPGTILMVSLAASCNVTGVAGSGAYCSADVDPIMFLDQKALDDLLGGNSFLLDDFFELEVSPNLVPEPGLWPLAACALAAALARRKSLG